MHYYSVIVMSIGAVRMHRGVTDRVPFCGHQDEVVDTKEQSVKTTIQFTSSSQPSNSEEGTHGTGSGVFAHFTWSYPVKWFGGNKMMDPWEKNCLTPW